MKKCPQCEFIYEDDQSLCDMDGVLLVFDSRTLPNLHALTTVSAPVPGKTSRRNRMVPAFATLILMLAVGSIYFVSTTLNAAPENIPPVSITSTDVVAEAPVVIPPAPTADEKTNETPRETHASPTAQPARKVTTTKPSTTKPESRKDDSKVGSILKKTGKILKKPFKF